jgi:hypothetical protein
MGTGVPIVVFDFYVEHRSTMFHCVGRAVDILSEGGCLFLDGDPFSRNGPT